MTYEELVEIRTALYKCYISLSNALNVRDCDECDNHELNELKARWELVYLWYSILSLYDEDDEDVSYLLEKIEPYIDQVTGCTNLCNDVPGYTYNTQTGSKSKCGCETE